MDLYRVKHSLAVANKMVEIGKQKGLNDIQLQELYILGYNHDIGYRFTTDKIKHNIVGGEILKTENYKYWKEVYNHGNPYTEYSSNYLDILNMADMQIDKYGNDVGFDERLEDIKNRYGSNSNQYINSKKIIDKYRLEGKNE